MKNSLQRSFSLIEVIVFVAIFGIFFVMAAAVTVNSLRDMKYNEHKIIATHYAEELLSWLRSEKDADWTVFITKDGNYCSNDTTIAWSTMTAYPCSSFGLSSFYKRELILNLVGTQMNVGIVVKWEDLGNTYQVPLNMVFTVWE